MYFNAMNLLAVVIFGASIFLSIANAQDCVWNKDTDFPSEYPPLLIELITWKSYLPVMENGERIIRILEGATVIVACPGKTLAIGGEVAEGICKKGSLIINGKSYHISNLACSARVDDDTNTDLPSQNCADGLGMLHEIGFNINGHQFYEIITVCFDDVAKKTINTKHTIYGKNIEGKDSNPSRPSFTKGDGFYDINPNDCYLTENQNDYFTNVWNDPDFIDTDSNKFFSRGHLASNGGFILEMDADASFYYINAIPQWQDYNGQNWRLVEEAIRALADDHKSDLEIWTGSDGQFVLEDTDIYICSSQNSNTIPIPKLIWKVVYENATNSGIAFVMSNIPHEEMPPIICPDVGCSNITWLGQYVDKPTSLSDGYTYCCTVQDLRRAVPGAPRLPKTVKLLD